MKLYLSTIGVSMAVIAALNLVLKTASWYRIVIAVLWCTALQFAFDGALAMLIRLLPDRYFGADNPLFHVSAGSRKQLERLQIRRWKDKIWELGGLGGFSKKELRDPKNPAYIGKFIIECNKGVVTHRLSYPIGFLAMLTIDGIMVFTVAFPVATVNLYLNILPTLVLRYNTPTLKKILSRMTQKCTENTSVDFVQAK